MHNLLSYTDEDKKTRNKRVIYFSLLVNMRYTEEEILIRRCKKKKIGKQHISIIFN